MTPVAMRLAKGERLEAYEILSFEEPAAWARSRARHTRLDRSAAVKVLPRELATDPSRLHRLEREARILSRVVDPNIVTVYDIGTEGSTTFIAMEFVEGAPLSDVLRQDRSASLASWRWAVRSRPAWRAHTRPASSIAT